MAGTEEEAAEHLEAALLMDVVVDRVSKGEDKGEGNKWHWDPLSSSILYLA